jgi:hypothetical protein
MKVIPRNCEIGKGEEWWVEASTPLADHSPFCNGKTGRGAIYNPFAYLRFEKRQKIVRSKVLNFLNIIFCSDSYDVMGSECRRGCKTGRIELIVELRMWITEIRGTW